MKQLSVVSSMGLTFLSFKDTKMEQKSDLTRNAICIVLPENEQDVHGLVSFH